MVLRSPYRAKAAKLPGKTLAGELKLYIGATTLSETLYVASRIHQATSTDNTNEEALDIAEWVKSRAQAANKDETLRRGRG